MDSKQFERLQAAVQWAVDEDRVRQAEESSLVRHEQRRWGLASEVKDTTIKATYTRSGAWYQGYQDNQELQVRAACVTACCLAGNVVLMNGDQFVIVKGDEFTWGDTGELQVYYCMDEDGQVHYIAPRAQELLGLTFDQSEALFHYTNNANAIVEIASRYAAESGFALEVI